MGTRHHKQQHQQHAPRKRTINTTKIRYNIPSTRPSFIHPPHQKQNETTVRTIYLSEMNISSYNTGTAIDCKHTINITTITINNKNMDPFPNLVTTITTYYDITTNTTTNILYC